jgi:hypothetical protein
MASENKIREWAAAILKILQDGTDDKAIENFVKFVSRRADALRGE